jgi:hypothetical protein
MKNGRENVEVSAGELHRSVGGYPGPDHRMPVCCSVMRFEFSEDCDRVLESPLSGDGASLTIRYNLPRNVEFSGKHLGAISLKERWLKLQKARTRVLMKQSSGK